MDPEQVGVLAICASAGYTALAALEEPALKSVAMVAPWLHDAVIARETYAARPALPTDSQRRERHATTT